MYLDTELTLDHWMMYIIYYTCKLYSHTHTHAHTHILMYIYNIYILYVCNWSKIIIYIYNMIQVIHII